jgi:alkanesulfonate monooxygenase SsuD/methylene tetrahydromethanopterin reductase-like flavin-dependent oxidoreductase (luciferase family)
MRTGVGIDERLGLSADQQRTLVQAAARLGFDSLWTPASATGRSAFHTCVRWWHASTEVTPDGLEVGISVVPFPVWSAPTLAAEAATVAEITRGKFSLGIGLGAYPAPDFLEHFGLPEVPPMRLTREYLEALTRLFNAQEVTVNGTGVRMAGVQLGFKPPRLPVYLAAMGPQGLRLAGELGVGVTPNWSSPEQIAWMREQAAAGARRASRPSEHVPFAQYIRVCVDPDADAARRAFGAQVLTYALARPGQPKDRGYRGHFGRMGFDEVLSDLEARREAGARMTDLVELVPPELMRKVGYFGPPQGAADAMRELSSGLDEAMVRLITVRPGDLQACLQAIETCRPDLWR